MSNPYSVCSQLGTSFLLYLNYLVLCGFFKKKINTIIWFHTHASKLSHQWLPPLFTTVVCSSSQSCLLFFTQLCSSCYRSLHFQSCFKESVCFSLLVVSIINEISFYLLVEFESHFTNSSEFCSQHAW